MTVEGLKTAFDWIAVILLFLTFAAGAGVLITGNIINKRQEQQLRQFDLDLTEAKTELGKQQERTASAVARVAGLEKSATDAKAAQQAVETKLAAQQEKTAGAERNLLALQRRMEPRSLSSDQRSRLIAALKASPMGKVDIGCILGDGEGLAFAQQVSEAINAAGWPQTGVSQGVYGPQNPVGFGIVVRSAITAPPYAASLQRAFFSIGLPLGGAENSQLQEGQVQILVGSKPSN